MPTYTRPFVPGGTCFFTVRLADGAGTLLIDEVDRLRDATRRTMARYPFRIDAIAVLPAVIHTLWTLPEGEANFALRWRMLKSHFSKSLPASPCARPKNIWQPRQWEHLIENAQDFDLHLQMIHASPVQAGLCARPADWPHSSVHRLAAQDPSDTPCTRRHSVRRTSVPVLARTYREEGFAHHP